jgi:hypothetical protein
MELSWRSLDRWKAHLTAYSIHGREKVRADGSHTFFCTFHSKEIRLNLFEAYLRWNLPT